ncbi:MAG: sulfatase-like hydrolase/transferase [Paludibacteraceae bacterium]|nr:sulfatase-like hydrolase/transferase [Paludibacteraceae bacterium]MBR0065150.1 sulfatase-like hydrolase/transferase [Paludibacteraceae bacterium]
MMDKKDRKASWIIFGLFTLLVFVQTLLFDHFAFREMELQPSWQNVVAMLLSKLAASMLFGSFTFLLRDKRWLIAISLIIDTWFVANLIYMRNNHILLDAEAFNMSGNLHGYFWSVLIYIEWGIDLLFVGLTALFSLVYLYTKQTARYWQGWLIMLLVAVVLRLVAEGIYVDVKKKTVQPEVKYDAVPFTREHREPVYGTHFPTTVANTSVLYSPLYITSDYYLMKNDIQPVRPLTPHDYAIMAHLDAGEDSVSLSSPLLIVLLESLENWVLTPQIMPNLYRLTQNDHVFYANRIHTQIMGAPSADGQMLVNTGLLPINAGGTCLHYWRNTYPAVMKLAPDSAVCLLPHDTTVWNQTHMSPAYGYDSTICYCDIDTILFQKLDSLVDDGWRYIQCITQSTHAPFVNEQYSHLALPKSMPWVMYNFIRGFNALDDGLAHLVRKIETDPVLQNYTIVITGDHRILHYEKRRQMQRYARHWADKFAGTDLEWIASLTPEDDCLPLIIYSPKISGNPHYIQDCYQMDIYPTYRSLVGAENYRWRGFGINLMDTTQKRPIDEDEAFQLSDRLIRNNYFKTK